MKSKLLSGLWCAVWHWLYLQWLSGLNDANAVWAVVAPVKTPSWLAVAVAVSLGPLGRGRPVGSSRAKRQSARLHAQLSLITAIVRLFHLIGQLELYECTCWWENLIIGRSMSYPGTIGGAVPISTRGNRASWPLYVTSNNKLCLGIQERWRTKSKTKLRLCTFCIWCRW